MPNGWTPVEEPSGWARVDETPKTESVSHAQLRGFKEGATQGASDLYAGTKEGLGGMLDMVRHPLDTAKAFGSEIGAAAEAVPDVVRDLVNPDARAATLKGLAKGGAEGAAGIDGKASFSRKVGQFIGGTVIPVVATGGAAKGLRMLRAGAPAVAAAEAAETAAKAPLAAAAPEAVAEAAQAAEPAFQQQAARKAPRITKVGEQAVKVSDLPQSWRPFVDVDLPTPAVEAAPTRNLPGIITKRTPKPGAVATAREALGAKEAGNIFGMSPDQVRAQAPGPSRRPMKTRMADLDCGL
jgi:hypothetical protein